MPAAAAAQSTEADAATLTLGEGRAPDAPRLSHAIYHPPVPLPPRRVARRAVARPPVAAQISKTGGAFSTRRWPSSLSTSCRRPTPKGRRPERAPPPPPPPSGPMTTHDDLAGGTPHLSHASPPARPGAATLSRRSSTSTGSSSLGPRRSWRACERARAQPSPTWPPSRGKRR